MARKQFFMDKFLYAGRVPVDFCEGMSSAAAGGACSAALHGNTRGDSVIGNVFVRTATAQPTLSSESDLQILDPAVATPIIQVARCWRQSYEHNRHFQDSWAARLSWAESVIGHDGCICQVWCKVCMEVEGREKLLVLKLDSLWKHAGQRKALTGFGKVKKGDHYFVSTNQHVKNKRIFFERGGLETVVQKVVEGATQEKKKKLVQFRLLFWLLSEGRPLTDFESSRQLLQQLAVPDMPRKHWSAFCGWEMADSMAFALSTHTKQVIADAAFISIFADEVTTIDHRSWLSIHLYVVVGFKRLSILLCLQRLVEGNGVAAITDTIHTSLDHHGVLSDDQIADKLLCFGADGVTVFQGSRSGVTVQLKKRYAPFMLGVHCMAHRTNLAVQPISNLPIVAKLESLCQVMYSYFNVSAKKHLEFQKLADIVETKGLKMLRNVKTRWISLLELLRRVKGEYKTLIVKMCEDATTKESDLTAKQAAARETARLNCDLLCDVSTLLALYHANA